MLLAAALRLWQLDVLPRLFFDEAYNGFDARQVLEGSVARCSSLPTTDASLVHLSPGPFDRTSVPHPSRCVVSAMVGIPTIPIMYFCAYTVLRTTPSRPAGGDRRAGWLALVAAAGLAVSVRHVSLSRWASAILLIPVSALAIVSFGAPGRKGEPGTMSWLASLWR